MLALLFLYVVVGGLTYYQMPMTIYSAIPSNDEAGSIIV